MNYKNENNVDAAEVAKFAALASEWWDLQGSMKPLHQMNPIRMEFILQQIDLKNRYVLDIGCGGGILSEALAKQGAQVTAIDLSDQVIEIAREHAAKQNLQIDYQCISAEKMAEMHPESFDVITCLELLEHVPNPLQTIQSCSQLIKNDGAIFFSTINRNIKSFFGAIIGAEYLLNLLPKGTHQYRQFIRPSELVHWATQAQLKLEHIQGICYRPLQRQFYLCADTDINYITHFTK